MKETFEYFYLAFLVTYRIYGYLRPFSCGGAVIAGTAPLCLSAIVYIMFPYIHLYLFITFQQLSDII
jgi:hypothetical protein